jgi:hypothetical protein
MTSDGGEIASWNSVSQQGRELGKKIGCSFVISPGMYTRYMAAAGFIDIREKWETIEVTECVLRDVECVFPTTFDIFCNSTARSAMATVCLDRQIFYAPPVAAGPEPASRSLLVRERTPLQPSLGLLCTRRCRRMHTILNVVMPGSHGPMLS